MEENKKLTYEEELTEEQMKEISAVIRAAAEDTPVPPELEPAAVEELLRKHQRGQESTSDIEGMPEGKVSAPGIDETPGGEASTSGINGALTGVASTSGIDGTSAGVDYTGEGNGDRKSKKKRPVFRRHARIYIGAAAAAVLVITALWRFSAGYDNGYTGDETTMAASGSTEEYAEELAEDIAGEDTAGSADAAEGATDSADTAADRTDTARAEATDGSTERIRIAKSYDEIYDLLKESNLTVDTGELYSLGSDTAGVMEESAAEDSAAGNGSSGAARQDTLGSSGSQETAKTTAVESLEASADYSETNVREQGVDEADIVKTDGTYAYVVSSGSSQVNIIRLADLTACGRVTAENGGSIQEIYVENGRLTLLTQVQTTSLTRRAGSAAGSAGAQDGDRNTSSNPGKTEDSTVESAVQDKQSSGSGTKSSAESLEKNTTASVVENSQSSDNSTTAATNDLTGITESEMQENPTADVIYSSDYRMESRLTVYDISDPTRPSKLGGISQEGNYRTSRMVDGYVYLFTDCWKDFLGNTDPTSTIPEINEQKLSSDCIYLPQTDVTGHYILISSVNMKEPSQVKEAKGVLCDGDEYYISTNNMYITQIRYDMTGDENTEIFRFAFRDGVIRGAAVGTVPGYIKDSFCLDEYDGHLRLVTTRWNRSAQISSLYVLDENLDTVGSLEDVAPDEEIKSARFVGSQGYFVTFRQTDPLFCVDLSRPEDPQIVGQVKVSGFSSYLHLYGDGLLLGIGSEADEDTGRETGAKISMFDISEPGQMTELARVGMKNLSVWSISDYRSLLVEPEKNLIGFVTDQWKNGKQKAIYYLYRWDEAKGFVELLSYEIPQKNGTDISLIRGFYAGSRFYVVSERGIAAFDMENGFSQAGVFSFDSIKK